VYVRIIGTHERQFKVRKEAKEGGSVQSMGKQEREQETASITVRQLAVAVLMGNEDEGWF